MKVYISTDIEGVCGVTAWDETELNSPQHRAAAEQMGKEAAAACRGAFNAGATEVFVKDSHDSGRNLLPGCLPDGVRLIRGWLGTPETMVGGIDNSFDACIFIGYHSEGGTNTNPLSHTISNSRLSWMKLNGHYLSELEINAYACSAHNVPVRLVSGDRGICDRAQQLIPGVVTVATKTGVGDATINEHPATVLRQIEEKAEAALKENNIGLIALPDEFELEICYKRHQAALHASRFPGAFQIDALTAGHKAHSVKDMLTAIMFMV